MEKDVVTTNDILPPAEEKPGKKKRKWLSRILSIFVFLVSTMILSFSGQVIYDYARYKSFYVNGESMYPTLNSHVVFTDASGVKHYGNADDSLGHISTWGEFHRVGTYVCDYGLMDSKEGFLSRIKRFDVVCTYYPSDYVDGVLKEIHYLKIKRVLAFPGESVKFDDDGVLYIKGKGESEYKEVEQSFYSASFLEENPSWLANTVKLKDPASVAKIKAGVELADDQYFLCGDNRLLNASSDSRDLSNGGISSQYITGIAYAIVGKCNYKIANNGSTSSDPNFWDIINPWNIQYIHD